MMYPVGLRQLGGVTMKDFSIVRIGNDYVVQAGEKSILKVASRRKAARLITDAAGLLDSRTAPPTPPEVETESSTAVIDIPDPPKVP